MNKNQLEGAISGWKLTEEIHEKQLKKGLLTKAEYLAGKERIEDIIKGFEDKLLDAVSERT